MPPISGYLVDARGAVRDDSEQQLSIVNDRAGTDRGDVMNAAGNGGRDLAAADLTRERLLGRTLAFELGLLDELVRLGCFEVCFERR